MIDPLSDYPGYMLRRVSAAAMGNLARRLKGIKLSPSEATVLSVIEANPDANQSEIGRLLDIARANMTPLVSRLERRDLVVRQPVDKRSNGLVLTRPGYQMAAKVKKIFAEHVAELVSRLSAGQQAALLSCAQIILSAFSDARSVRK